jgi:hypothetical protein
MQGEGKAMKVLGFSASERAAFQKMVLMFGLGDGTWRHLIRERGALKRKSYAEIVAYGNLYLAHLLEPKDLSSNPSTYADGVPKDTTVKRKDILTRIAKLHLIESKMRSSEALEVSSSTHPIVGFRRVRLTAALPARTLTFEMAGGRSCSSAGEMMCRCGSGDTTTCSSRPCSRRATASGKRL